MKFFAILAVLFVSDVSSFIIYGRSGNSGAVGVDDLQYNGLLGFTGTKLIGGIGNMLAQFGNMLADSGSLMFQTLGGLLIPAGKSVAYVGNEGLVQSATDFGESGTVGGTIGNLLTLGGNVFISTGAEAKRNAVAADKAAEVEATGTKAYTNKSAKTNAEAAVETKTAAKDAAVKTVKNIAKAFAGDESD